MKVMFKPEKIQTFEAIRVNKKLIGKTITDMPIMRQKILLDNDGKLVLRAHEIDDTTLYKSVQDIDVYLEEGDYLIKTPKGYMKPVKAVVPVEKPLQNAIDKLNNL